MASFTISTLADETAYDIINKSYDVNAHYGKAGNMVRLFGDTVADRAEIWKARNGYDVFIGKNTKLYGIGSSLIESDWSNSGKLRYSKSNELALKGLTGSDVALLLECVKRVDVKAENVVKPKTTSKRRNSKRNKAEKTA